MDKSEEHTTHAPAPSVPSSPGIDRRDFLNEIAGTALGIAGVGATIVLYRYLCPNVLFEPPLTFRAGTPDVYPVNSVSYIDEQEVYIVRTDQGLYALSAICTHLGCITVWHPEDKLIECPCHGSKFRRDGTKVAGPAPRPLPRLSITLTEDGELRVNKGEIVPPNQLLRV
jgi:cytochrome b6-f complex iron-sulfur subunit